MAQKSAIIPAMRYQDAPAAIDWLCEAFGLERHLVVPGPDGTITHAQLSFGSGMIMLGSGKKGEFDKMLRQPGETDGQVTQTIYMVVDDVDGHCDRARAAGAQITTEPEDQDYGGRLYTCRDLEGHVWSFGSYDPWA